MADFFFKTSRISYYLLIVPKAYRYPLTVTMLCALATLWFFLLYKPLYHYYCASVAQLNQLHSTQQQSIKIKQTNRALHKEVQKKNSQLSKALKNYTQMTLQEVVTLLFDEAHTSQITVQSHSPAEAIDADWYTMHIFSTSFRGPFTSMVQFLEKMYAKKVPITLKKTTMSKVDPQTTLLACDFVFNEIKEDR